MNGELGHRATDYGRRAVEAARSVMAELCEMLGRFGDAAVLVGGWFPELSFPAAQPGHVGSLDVDVLLDPDRLPPAKVEELSRILKAHGYRRTEPPFKFVKTMSSAGGEPVAVEVDFLIPAGAPLGPLARRGGAIRAAQATGGTLALHSTHSVVLEGRTPDGRPARVAVTLPGVGAWLVMKAHALASRGKEKDAYDIAFCLRNMPGATAAVAKELAPHKGEPEVHQALESLRARFRFPGDFGPQAFARFVDPADPDERAFLARDAFERVQALLRALGLAEDGIG